MNEAIIHRWKHYSTVVVRGHRVGGRFYNVREAWDFAREELEIPRSRLQVIDHVNPPKVWEKRLP